MKVGHSDLVLCVCVLVGVALCGKVQALKEFQRSVADEKQNMGLTLQLNIWYVFVKLDHSDLVLLRVTLNGMVHALMEFQRSLTHKKWDMG